MREGSVFLTFSMFLIMPLRVFLAAIGPVVVPNRFFFSDRTRLSQRELTRFPVKDNTVAFRTVMRMSSTCVTVISIRGSKQRSGRRCNIYVHYRIWRQRSLSIWPHASLSTTNNSNTSIFFVVPSIAEQWLDANLVMIWSKSLPWDRSDEQCTSSLWSVRQTNWPRFESVRSSDWHAFSTMVNSHECDALATRNESNAYWESDTRHGTLFNIFARNRLPFRVAIDG